METLEKIKWLPIWLIMFSLIFTTGAYFYKQSLLTHTADEVLREAANKGKFTSQDVEELTNRLDDLGFDKSKLQIEISPADALNVGVSKDDSEYIELIIDPQQKAFISNIFSLLTNDDDPIKYYYKRIAKSEEYID